MQTAEALRQMQQLRASMMKEKEDELSLFLEMRKLEKERSNLLLPDNDAEDFDAPLGSKPGTSPLFNISTSAAPPARKTGADDFLNTDGDKNDYDWLLTPPGTPLFPSLEMESQRTVVSQIGTPKARPTALKSRLANPQPEPALRNNFVSRQPASSPGLNTSSAGVRRPSSSGGPGSRAVTPTRRPTLTAASKPSRTSTPTSRATLPSTKPTPSTTKSTISTTKPSVSTTKTTVPANRTTVPAVKTTVPAVKTTVPSRSSTPSRSTARSSTPTTRPSIPSSKSTSRAATPTRRPSTLSSAPSISASPVKSSPPVTKPALTRSKNPVPSLTTAKNSVPSLTSSKNPVPSCGVSPTVKSRPWNPSKMSGFSPDAPPNLRTAVPERPISATRGRPGAPSPRSSSVEPVSNGRPRRQSCSPSRGKPPNGFVHPSGSSVPAVSRGYSKVNDNVSPVVIGTKMVERVINMRRLAPPIQDSKNSPQGNPGPGGKSSSPDSSGFGRTLSKKSLDMAIRHMDIRRIIPGNLRPSMTNIPASSMYSVRSGTTRGRTISVSDSPPATSSNASSEVSVNNWLSIDGIEIEDDVGR